MNASTRRRFLCSLSWPVVGSLAFAAAPKNTLRAGAAKADITLPLGAINGGFILRGAPVRQIHDELHARCLVLDDGSTQLALVVCDLRMISRNLVDRAKSLAAAALGWPASHLLVAATHTHAAPGLVNLQQAEIDRWYADFVVVRIADAIRRAAANLAPARIGWGSDPKPAHVFNRRYKVKPSGAPPNPFGQSNDQVVTNPSAAVAVLEPAGPVDPELSIISVQHADGRPLAVLANYGLHYVGGYTADTVSADYFAVFAERIGQLLDVNHDASSFLGMMSNGASGDVNNVNPQERGQRTPPWQKMREVAEDLAQTTARLCETIEYHDSARLNVGTRELELAVRRPDEDRLAWARQTMAGIRDKNKLTRPEVYADETLALAASPPTVSILLQALRIGPLGIAAAPCEVFAETGLEIKRDSSLKPTFLMELANGFSGYLPTPQQHAWGGYETWPARSSFLEIGAAPKIRDGLVELLGTV